MSYVLDALRRADAERQQGRPPDLNAPGALRASAPAPHPAAAAVASARLTRGWPWLAALLLAALAALGTGLMLPRLTPDERQHTPPGGAAASAETGAPRTAATTPRPVPGAMPGTVAGAAPIPPRPVTAPPPELPVPSRAAASALEPTALPLERLDPALRQSLPPLAFSGAMDSPDPAARMLIVNGRLLREGDSVASDLVLERIALRSAVLRWRGQRIEVRY